MRRLEKERPWALFEPIPRGSPARRSGIFLQHSIKLGRIMNDPAVRVALTISIFMGCLFIAIVFRPILSMPAGAVADLNAPLSLRHQRALPPPSVGQEQAPVSMPPGEQGSSAQPSSQSPIVLLPLGSSQGGPSSPPHWPAYSSTNSARWGMPMDMMPAAARGADGPQTHRIVDGDSLADLAARYLGSALRQARYFKPTGTCLRIPSCCRSAWN